MNTEEQARERMAHQRQESEHLQEAMKNRAEAEVQQGTNSTTEDLARQHMAQQRHQGEQVQESMLTRTEDELGVSHDATDSSQQQS